MAGLAQAEDLTDLKENDDFQGIFRNYGNLNSSVELDNWNINERKEKLPEMKPRSVFNQ